MIHLSSVLTGYRNLAALHGALLLPLFTASVAALGSNGTLWFNFNEYGTFTKLSQVASALCLIFLFLHILFSPRVSLAVQFCVSTNDENIVTLQPKQNVFESKDLK